MRGALFRGRIGMWLERLRDRSNQSASRLFAVVVGNVSAVYVGRTMLIGTIGFSLRLFFFLPVIRLPANDSIFEIGDSAEAEGRVKFRVQL